MSYQIPKFRHPALPVNDASLTCPQANDLCAMDAP